MNNTVVISNKMTNSGRWDLFPFLGKGNKSNTEEENVFSFYLEFIPHLDIIIPISHENLSESYLTMLASEDVLKKDWDDPVEDEAWADL